MHVLGLISPLSLLRPHLLQPPPLPPLLLRHFLFLPSAQRYWWLYDSLAPDQWPLHLITLDFFVSFGLLMVLELFSFLNFLTPAYLLLDLPGGLCMPTSLLNVAIPEIHPRALFVFSCSALCRGLQGHVGGVILQLPL